MELPRRARGDEFLPDGSYTRLSQRLAANPANADVTCLIVYAFDFRTRMLPFMFADKLMVPAGPRAVASALYHAGFKKTRIVLQQWNPNFKITDAKIDGRPPDVLLVSAMQIHVEPAYNLIAETHAMGADRPLILCGGPKAIYEPEHLFTLGAARNAPAGADAVVTGEEFITLELLEALTANRGKSESMLTAFHRVRREGGLRHIAGLVYEDPAPPAGVPRRLIQTGVQRLLRDLDELPDVVTGYRLLEPPSRWRTSLSSAPLADEQVYRHARVSSLVTTHGCKFACNYCPIPAYNQRTWRQKSTGRMVEEAARLHEHFGFRYFFGTDDNFFNNRSTVEDFFGAFAKAEWKGKPVRHNFRFGTEATEFDVYRNRDLLPLAKKAGLFAIWFGIEDMTAELINKGQSAEKTKELFAYMTSLGLSPMAMMMHHDSQPLVSHGSLHGLLNQAKFLFDAGAVTYQCTILSPAIGTRVFEDTFLGGHMIKSINGQNLEEYTYDGNHAVASSDPQPWRRQLNLLAAYTMFYNPLNFLRVACTPSRDWTRRMGAQLFGHMSLPMTAWQMLSWAWKLYTGKIEYWKEVPAMPLPVYWINEPNGQRPSSKPPAVLPIRPNISSLPGVATAAAGV